MAMRVFNKVARSSNDLTRERYIELSRSKPRKPVTIVEFKKRYETTRDELYHSFVEVSYLIPEFTKSQRLKLNNLCKKIECFYNIEDVQEEFFLEKGFKKRIVTTVPALQDNRYIIKLNDFFGVTN